MSISPLLFKALRNLETLNSWQTQIPIQWKNKKKQFTWNDSWKDVTPWYVSFFLLVILHTFFGSLGIIGYMRMVPQTDKFALVVRLRCMYSVLGSFLGIIIAIVICFDGKDYIEFINRIITFDQHATAELRRLEVKPVEKFDPFANAMYLVVLLLSIIPPVYCIPPVIHGHTVLQYIVHQIYPNFMKKIGFRLMIKIVNYFVMLVSVTEIFRLIPLMFLSLSLPVITARNELESMDRYGKMVIKIRRLELHGSKVIPHFCAMLGIYCQGYILISIRRQISAGHDFIVFVVSITLSVVANYFTIVLYPIVPQNVYPAFPTVAVSTITVLHLLISIAVDVVVKAKEFTVEWGKLVPVRNRYLAKKFRALRPFQIVFGVYDFPLVVFSRSLKIKTYQTIWDYTINTALTWPLSLFQK